MFSWISNIFSSSSTEKIIDAGISGIDKVFYTEEEKSEMKLKLGNLHLEYLKAYAPFKIAQRMLAFIFTSLFAVCFIVALVLKSQGLDISFIYELVKSFSLDLIVTVIVGFYFAGGTIESFRKVKND